MRRGEWYLHQFKGESLMEDAVDSSSSRQLIGINLVTGAFNTFLEVHSKLLDHPRQKKTKQHEWGEITRCTSPRRDAQQESLTEAELWSSGQDHQGGSSYTHPPLSQWREAGSEACSAGLEGCLGCDWSVAAEVEV